MSSGLSAQADSYRDQEEAEDAPLDCVEGEDVVVFGFAVVSEVDESGDAEDEDGVDEEAEVLEEKLG